MKGWRPDMTTKEERDLAFWERNMLALHFAQGWYFDDLEPDRLDIGQCVLPVGTIRRLCNIAERAIDMKTKLGFCTSEELDAAITEFGAILDPDFT